MAEKTSSKPVATKRSTPRDRLAEYAKKAGLDARALTSVREWIAEQFVADEFAKLSQGGHAESQVPLRRVFVDLPVSETPLQESSNAAGRTLLLRLLQGLSPLPLKRYCDPSQDLSAALFMEVEHEPLPSRTQKLLMPRLTRKGQEPPAYAGILLIGGPGQGKSTLGQLACQLQRASLLLPYKETLSSHVLEVLTPFTDQEKKRKPGTGLEVPKEGLLPLRIVLPEAASWLAQDAETSTPVPALLHFLATRTSALNHQLKAETLLALAGRMPSLLFLDGFDEVGATTDRQRIVDACRELITALGQRGASALMVATTRPQGYAGELSRIGAPLAERHLAPLKTKEALDYARRLVEAKIQGAEAQHKALQRLEEAAKEPATARLLRTPLQVTILTALVQQRGRLPGERWKLFSGYFNYTLDREIERNTYASGLLRDHRSHIEALHTRVGLLLQVEAETGGGAASRISRTRLEEIVQSVLREDEFEESDCLELGREMVDAAEKRLVFLVEPEPGQFGFEIRSLQEFMAAWALTEGRERAVEERFRQVAKAPLFRNVLLFMASRFFSERSGLRELPSQVCIELDEDRTDAMARLVHAGAMLALEVLEEGAVQTQPKRARSLMERASHLLDLPPDEEHARLARVTDEHTAPVLQAALESRLGASENDAESSRYAAWVCLLELVNRGLPWAPELAEKFWPVLREPVEMLGAISQSGVVPGRWLLNRIVAEAERFPPKRLRSLWIYSEHDLQLPRELEAVRVPFRLIGLREDYSCFAFGLTRDTQDGREDTLLTEHASPAWNAYAMLSQFSDSPSRERLAATLRAIREGLPVEDWNGLGWLCPWPHAVCLTYADSPEALRQLEASVLEGRLGEADDWYSAQEKWHEVPPLSDLLDSIAQELPWDLQRLHEGPPLSAIHFHIGDFHFATSGAELEAGFARLSQLYRTTGSAASRSKLAALGLSLLLQSPTSLHLELADLRSWLQEYPDTIPQLLLCPPAIEHAEWLELLLSTNTSYFSGPPGGSLASDYGGRAAKLLETPTEPEFLLLWLYTDIRLWQSVLELSDVRRLRGSLRGQHFSHPKLNVAATLLRIYLGDVELGEEEILFQHIADYARETPGIWSKFRDCLKNGLLSAPETESFLILAHSESKGHPFPPTKWIPEMRTALQARRTGLHERSAWDRLALPLPYPRQPMRPRVSQGMPEQPIVLERVRLQRVRGLVDLTLQLSPPRPDEGQWVVLLGPNGAGKTTFLRSLALALRNLTSPSLWPKGTFAIPWKRIGDSNESSIEVTLEGNVQHLTRIRSNGTENFFQEPEQTAPRLFPLFAYGCRRGSALGGAAREVDLSDDDGPEIATLFDEGAGLIHAETWLMQWDGDAQKNPESKAIFSAVTTALCELLAVERIEVRDQKVWITEPGRSHPLPMKALSDGYLTTTGWFLDLVARWIALSRQFKTPIDPHFLKRMTGLVLLDEIDLYLHPQWQVDVIARTRRLLPRMSFIVTTHNPLTLVGARAEEIWTLSTQKGRVTAQKGTETPMLLTGGQLFSRYFGIKDIMPHELGRKLQRYGFLSGFALRNDEEQAELERLRTELNAQGIDPGWEEVPREPIASSDLSTPTVSPMTAPETPPETPPDTPPSAPTKPRRRAKS